MNLHEIVAAVPYEPNYRRNKTFHMQLCRGELIACSLVDEWTDGLFLESDAAVNRRMTNNRNYRFASTRSSFLIAAILVGLCFVRLYSHIVAHVNGYLWFRTNSQLQCFSRGDDCDRIGHRRRPQVQRRVSDRLAGRPCGRSCRHQPCRLPVVQLPRQRVGLLQQGSVAGQRDVHQQAQEVTLLHVVGNVLLAMYFLFLFTFVSL